MITINIGIQELFLLALTGAALHVCWPGLSLRTGP
jgi:hypothetical protein